MIKILTALVFTVVMATCQPATSDPTAPAAGEQARAEQPTSMLATDRQSYVHDQEARLTLHNQTQEMLGFNLCMSTLERRQGEQWVAVPNFPRDPCPALLNLMGPGQTASFGFRLDRGLPTGEYRFRTRIEHTESAQDRWHVSNPFQLTG